MRPSKGDEHRHGDARFPASSDGAEAGGLPVAAVQMVSGSTLQDNLQTAARLVGQAADQGAKLIALPEYFCLMGQRESDKLAIAEPYQPTPLDLPQRRKSACHSDAARRLARDHRIWLVGGSIPLVSDQPNKVLNTCLTYDPEGRFCTV